MGEEDFQQHEVGTRRRALEPILYLIGLPIASYLVVGAFVYAVFILVSAFALPVDTLVASQDEPGF